MTLPYIPEAYEAYGLFQKMLVKLRGHVFLLYHGPHKI